MPIEPIPPSPLLLFGIMFVGVLGAIGMLMFFAFLTRTLQGRAVGTHGSAAGVQRSRASYRSTNSVRQRSRQQNAEKSQRSAVQSFSERSKTNVTTGDTIAIPPLPITPDEMQKLAHAITLYARRPNKQLAIEAAWSCTKGDGEDWKRGITLFDAAMGGAAMHVAKTKIGSEQAVSAVVAVS